MSKKLLVGLVVVVVALVIARIMLPTWVKNAINRELADLETYQGHVEEVDIALWRGAYQIHNLKVQKKVPGGEPPIPFVDIDRIDLSIFWSALFKGALVGEVDLHGLALNFVDAASKDKDQTGAGAPWQETVKKGFPLRIDRVGIHNSRVHFHNFDAKPEINLALSQINGTIRNLTNSEKISKSLFTSIEINGKAMEHAPVVFTGNIDPYSQKPTYDINVRMTDLELAKINDFAKHYGKIDFEKGTFSLTVEAASKNGDMNGYIKPIFKHVEVVSWEGDVKKDKDNVFHVVWEAIVGGVEEILQNQKKDQFATKIPIQTTAGELDIDVWTSIINVLRNGFVRAFMPWFEGSEEKKS